MGLRFGYVTPGHVMEMDERRLAVARMIREGKQAETIAAELDCSLSNVYYDIEFLHQEFREARQGEVAPVRYQTSAMLRRQIEVLTPLAEGGNLKASETLRKYLAQYAELWGANMPVKQQVELSLSKDEIAALPDDELRKLLPP